MTKNARAKILVQNPHITYYFQHFGSISTEANNNVEFTPADVQCDRLKEGFPQQSAASGVETRLINMPKRFEVTISQGYDSPTFVSNVQEDEHVSTPCINNEFEDLPLAEDNNIRATYENLFDDPPCFQIQEVLTQCITDLERIKRMYGIQQLLVFSAPGPKVCVCGEDIERIRQEIEDVFLDFEIEVRVQNLPSSGSIPHISWLARLRKIFGDVVQKEVESELIVTAIEKQFDGSQLEVMYAIVPAHLLHSADKNKQPPGSINLVEPASQQFSFAFVKEETQACKLLATPIFKYRITRKIQKDEQIHSYMNDIALMKFWQKPRQALNSAVKPLPIPKKSYIDFLSRRQSVVMVGGHAGRIIPLPNVIGNDSWSLGLHLAFVIPSSGSNQSQSFEEGDCGKILHIQDKQGHWIPVAMLVGKYTVEIPEYGSSIYIAIILNEALNEIEKDFGEMISNIQLHPTASLHFVDGPELNSEEYLCISSKAELKHNKERFALLNKLKELKVKDTKLDSCDVEALERLTFLKKLELHKCELQRTSKIDSAGGVVFESLSSLEKLKMHYCNLSKSSLRIASLPNLKRLNLSCSKMDSTSPVIESLESLQKLDMCYCNLSKSLLRITSLPSLKELNLSDSKMDFASPVVIEYLDSLEKLDMRYCNLSQSSLRVASLPSLKELNLSYSKMDSASPVVIEHMDSLEKLNMMSCKFDKSQLIISSLPSLKELNLSDSKMDSASPVVIENLDSLEKLDMRNCNFSKSPLRLSSLPSLKELNLSYSKIDTASPVVIENLDSLEKLNMRLCQFSELPIRFASMTTLKQLDIGGRQLDSVFLVGIDALVSLEKLGLYNCDLTKLPFRFDSLTNLKELYLNSNKLDSESLVGMEKLVLLEKLNLSSCDLKELPFRLSSLSKLRDLSLRWNPLDPDTLDEIVKLESLERLNLACCWLTKLPNRFERLKKLEHLCLNGNNFEEYPSVLRSLPSETKVDISEFDFSTKRITREPANKSGSRTSRLRSWKKALTKKFGSTKVMNRGTTSRHQESCKSWTEVAKTTCETTGNTGRHPVFTEARAGSKLVEATLGPKASAQQTNQLAQLQGKGHSSSKPLLASSRFPIQKYSLRKKLTSSQDYFYSEEFSTDNHLEYALPGRLLNKTGNKCLKKYLLVQLLKQRMGKATPPHHDESQESQEDQEETRAVGQNHALSGITRRARKVSNQRARPPILTETANVYPEPVKAILKFSDIRLTMIRSPTGRQREQCKSWEKVAKTVCQMISHTGNAPSHRIQIGPKSV
ncbi:uncharacterized protein [Watersipora subatra]|uniref:uncharacterized protein n=1 Tax=Watersipora subatra TaxID=2589382 RepID=UPI00355BD027